MAVHRETRLFIPQVFLSSIAVSGSTMNKSYREWKSCLLSFSERQYGKYSVQIRLFALEAESIRYRIQTNKIIAKLASSDRFSLSGPENVQVHSHVYGTTRRSL